MANECYCLATNRADVWITLLRPGRFDRRVNITLPERKDREAIKKFTLEKANWQGNYLILINWSKTAHLVRTCVLNMANEAAIICARRNKKRRSQMTINWGVWRVTVVQSETKIMNDHEKELTTYHEAGHAVWSRLAILTRFARLQLLFRAAVLVEVTWFLPPEDETTQMFEF